MVETTKDVQTSVPGIVPELGELGPGAIITEAALAKMLKRHQVTLKRAVQRRELPPPVRLLGGPVWTVGVIVRHLEARLAAAAKDAERTERKIQQLRP